MDSTRELHEKRRIVHHGSHTGKGIAVFTSGGDSQGMNAAVRAVVRMSLFVGCKVCFIKEGYQGMVDGDKNIIEANWSSVSHIIHKGGTVIGSARCMEFVERSGRLKAAKNLVINGISNLVVIGGDGSLTGANLFREEWADLLDELLGNGEITEEERKKYKELHIVGLVGSIDNDFCGTDMTIGTDTALHRIMEAIDAISSTANSHQRTFIMEVMGRHCGYLALVAANCSEADYVFIPEFPAHDDWPETMCSKLIQERSHGKRLNIIIVSEGATDRSGQPITAEMVKQVIVDQLKQDARITVLGHVQRGGHPSAFDRALGCRLGSEAVMTLMESTSQSEACVVTLHGNQVVRIPLMECVARTKAVAQAMKDKDWDGAVKLRGFVFERNLETYKMLARMKPPARRFSLDGKPVQNYTVAIMHVGVPACGMNAAVRSIIRNFLCPGSTIYGINDGIEGLIAGNFQKMEWQDVSGWVGQGGAMLGCKKTLPKKLMTEIAPRLRQFHIQALFIIGGFESYQAGLQFVDQRNKYPEFCIPIVVLPATSSNNIPGTECSLGCDTALNEIVAICDRIRQSSQGTKRHVYIIETMGGYCGYLASMGGFTGGSDAAYIYEEKFSVNDIVRDVTHMKAKMTAGIQRGLLLKSDKANENFNTEFIYRLYSEEAKDDFTVTMNIIGQMQQGGNPTPFDRNMGTKMGMKSANYVIEQLTEHCQADGTVRVETPKSAVMIGIIKSHYTFTPLLSLKNETNFEQRIPKEQWWLRLRSLGRILAKHDSSYQVGGELQAEMVFSTVDELSQGGEVSNIEF